MITDKRHNDIANHFSSLLYSNFEEYRGKGPNLYAVVLFLITLRKFNGNPISVGYSSSFLELIKNKVDNLANKQDYAIKELYEALEYYIRDMGTEKLSILIQFLEQQTNGNLDVNEKDLFDLFFEYFISTPGYPYSGFIPNELCNLINILAPSSPGTVVYQPFAGIGELNKTLPNDVYYFGQERNALMWAVGKMQAFFSRQDSVTYFDHEDSIYHWGKPKNNRFNHQEKRFDHIVSMPPFRAKIDLPVTSVYNSLPIRTIEEFVIDRGIHSLKPNGKLIVFISNAFLTSGGSERSLREYLIQHDKVETILQLPTSLLPNAGIPITMLVLSGKKERPDIVHLIDATSFFKKVSSRLNKLDLDKTLEQLSTQTETEQSRFVKTSEIARQDYSLSVNRYFVTRYFGTNLNYVLTAIPQLREGVGIHGKYARIRDLKHDFANFTLKAGEIEDGTKIPLASYKLTESALLIAGRWKELRPTFFQYEGIPIFVSNDIYAFRVDQKRCNIQYLVSELYEHHVLKQFEKLSTGSTIPRISRKDLLEIDINLPSKKEQDKFISLRLETLQQKKQKELLTELQLQGFEDALFSQNAYLRHTLAGPATNLKAMVANIVKLLNEKVFGEHPEYRTITLSDKHTKTLADYLQVIERDANAIHGEVSRQLQSTDVITSTVLHPVEIVGFLQDYVAEKREHPKDNFEIILQVDEELKPEGIQEKVYINAHPDLLRLMLDNLLENAIQHAFPGFNNNRFEIFMNINSISEAPDEITILVSNTGRSFPKDLSLDAFGRKGFSVGATAGDGMGGNIITNVIARLNGTLDIIDETGPEGFPGSDLATSFEILIPLTDNPLADEV
jgi:type I restriction enzyme M protein